MKTMSKNKSDKINYMLGVLEFITAAYSAVEVPENIIIDEGQNEDTVKSEEDENE